jgi:type I restriction enzyme S subunit
MMKRWELPQGWEWRKLNDLVSVIYGKSLPETRRLGGNVPIYGSNGIIGFHNAPLTRGATIIIGRKGSAGAINWSETACWPIDTTFFIDEFPTNIYPKFLYSYLRSQQIAQLQQSAAIPGLNRDVLYKIPVPLPYPDDPARSLAEQQRIVARLEALLGEVRALREDVQSMRRDLAQVMESALVEVFPDTQGELPRGWDKIRLNDEVIDILSGFSCARKYAVQTGLLHLRPFNIGINGELDLTQQIYVPDDRVSDPVSYYLQKEDILFNNTNSVELVGKSAIVRKPMECAFSNHLTRIRVIDQERLNPQWLLLALRTLWLGGFFAANCNRWIGQAGFAPTKLAELEIPAPLLAEQRRIVTSMERIAEETRAMDALLEHDLRDLDALEQSILAAAFRGEM